MTIKNLTKNLQSKGYDVRPVTMGDGRPAVMVSHDYDGPYPTRETWRIHEALTAYATRNSFKSEGRGYYTATLIW